MLFLTLVFAATSYPIGSMVIVVVASVTGVAILGAAGGATDQPFEPDPAYGSASASATSWPCCRAPTR